MTVTSYVSVVLLSCTILNRAGALECEIDWLSYNRSTCFRLFKTQVTWATADISCRNKGATLAPLNDNDIEISFLANLLQPLEKIQGRKQCRFAWTGNRKRKKCPFTKRDGSRGTRKCFKNCPYVCQKDGLTPRSSTPISTAYYADDNNSTSGTTTPSVSTAGLQVKGNNSVTNLAVAVTVPVSFFLVVVAGLITTVIVKHRKGQIYEDTFQSNQDAGENVYSTIDATSSIRRPRQTPNDTNDDTNGNPSGEPHYAEAGVYYICMSETANKDAWSCAQEENKASPSPTVSNSCPQRPPGKRTEKNSKGKFGVLTVLKRNGKSTVRAPSSDLPMGTREVTRNDKKDNLELSSAHEEEQCYIKAVYDHVVSSQSGFDYENNDVIEMDNSGKTPEIFTSQTNESMNVAECGLPGAVHPGPSKSGHIKDANKKPQRYVPS